MTGKALPAVTGPSNGRSIENGMHRCFLDYFSNSPLRKMTNWGW
jgi:hypothetical protein